MLPRTRIPGAFLILLLLVQSAFLSGLDIKIASVAPENSPYGEILNQLAADWIRLSKGAVRVIVYHDGIAGGQADILRKMRIGQIQGGVFSNAGLAAITRELLSISVPFLIRSDAECDEVLRDMIPFFDNTLEARGFKAVVWARAGWLYLFSKSRVHGPEEMQTMKLAVPQEQAELMDTLKALGYRAVQLNVPETLPGLNSGLVDATLTSPLFAAGYQWFGVASFMLDMKIAPVLGCVILNNRVWRQIPERFRNPFLASAAAAQRRLEQELEALDDRAIEVMSSYGLNLIAPSDVDRRNWASEFERNRERVIDSAFDRKSIERIERTLSAFRTTASN